LPVLILIKWRSEVGGRRGPGEAIRRSGKSGDDKGSIRHLMTFGAGKLQFAPGAGNPTRYATDCLSILWL